MSQSVKQQLTTISANASGSHKDQSDKYRAVLESISVSPPEEARESLKALVDQCSRHFVYDANLYLINILSFTLSLIKKNLDSGQ